VGTDHGTLPLEYHCVKHFQKVSETGSSAKVNQFFFNEMLGYERHLVETHFPKNPCRIDSYAILTAFFHNEYKAFAIIPRIEMWKGINAYDAI
jgi:hypothetical protein